MQRTDWFSVRVVAGSDAAVVVLAGAMDLAAAASFEAVFRATVESAPSDVVIDLHAVVFIDAAGLAALVRAQRLGSCSGLRVGFERPSAACRRIVELTRQEGLLAPAAAGVASG